MAQSAVPKVCLFDIGGVCVSSPFQAVLDHEQKHSIPQGYINFAISRSSPNGAWARIERGEIPLDEAFYRDFKADLERESCWQEFHQRTQSPLKYPTLSPSELPRIPDIDAKGLFYNMMIGARHVDPYVFPTLHKLKASGKFKLAALSNNIIYPKDHELRTIGAGDVWNVFDVFVGSASVGMRKPDPKIYEYTLDLMRKKWGTDLRPEDIVFMDDIGENCKAARKLGIRTIKVVLGKTDEAVRELEKVTGMELLDRDGSKGSDRPRL